MNVPNALTCLRIALAFVLLFLFFLSGFLPKILAIAVFLAASLTDYWDGKIARSSGQITVFGKLMDPIADKFLTLAAFIGFTQKGLIAPWMVLLVVARDFLITGVRLSVPPKKDLQSARQSGKNKTVLQYLFIYFVLGTVALRETSYWNPAWEAPVLGFIRGAMGVIVIVTLWSGANYLIKNRELFE